MKCPICEEWIEQPHCPSPTCCWIRCNTDKIIIAPNGHYMVAPWNWGEGGATK